MLTWFIQKNTHTFCNRFQIYIIFWLYGNYFLKQLFAIDHIPSIIL